MNRRHLTREEATLIEQAAERWLRLRDVELNAAEEALALLARSELRAPDCARRDLATLERPLLLELPGRAQPVCLTLVPPGKEDAGRARVSVIGPLGLALVGRKVGSRVTLPRGEVRFAGFADAAAPRRQLAPVM